MARRVEVTVPKLMADEARNVIQNPLLCDLSPRSSTPGDVVEIDCDSEIIFRIVIPGKSVTHVLKCFEKMGFGSKYGSISLSSLDCWKPRFQRHQKKEPMVPLNGKRLSIMENIFNEITMDSAFRDFRKPPLTLDEVYGNIVVAAHMTTTSWINIIGASVVGAGGAAANNSYFIVASMLVSPIMGPILGATFAYRVADWKLMRHALKNLLYMSISSFSVGFFLTIPLGLYNLNDHKRWRPEPETINSFADLTNLIFSSAVSMAAGVILGNAILKNSGPNSLIGIAISAGLLPPIVFSGMLLSFGVFHAGSDDNDDMPSQADYLEQSRNSFLSFATHAVCIFVFSNFIFLVKDINPGFREVDDIKWEEAPTHKKFVRELKQDGIEYPDEKSGMLRRLTPMFMFSAMRGRSRSETNACKLGQVSEETLSTTQNSFNIFPRIPSENSTASYSVKGVANGDTCTQSPVHEEGPVVSAPAMQTATRALFPSVDSESQKSEKV